MTTEPAADPNLPPAIPLMASHILTHLPPAPRTAPLFVLLQGPQGSGKTFLCSSLSALLRAPPNNLRVAVLSIDDLYLPHDALLKLAKANAANPLLQGRGQPGTHDLPLGARLFRALAHARAQHTTILPVFDKSLFGGAGDRAGEGVPVFGQVDVVLVEGWCTGFYPLSEAELERRYARYAAWDGPEIPPHEIGHVQAINEHLKAYAAEWWPVFDVFVQITPMDLKFVHEWRLQQEHNMKAQNGGKGMTDEQVKAFVDRYLPGYYYFADGVDHGHDVPPTEGQQATTPWAGRGLRVVIDRGRNLVRSETF